MLSDYSHDLLPGDGERPGGGDGGEEASLQRAGHPTIRHHEANEGGEEGGQGAQSCRHINLLWH